MKVRVSFTVNIDADAWSSEYGVALENVRADVQEYARHVVLGQFGDNGLLATEAPA